MLPLLAFASDQQDHNMHDAIDALAKTFDLSDDERKELLPSGRQAKFDNRIAWAVTHLAKAGLLFRPHRGYFQITPRGEDVLATNPTGINMSYLSQFPEYLAFKDGSTSSPSPNGNAPHAPDNPIQTPEEILELGYLALRTKTVQELLERVKACSPRFFEQLVVDLLVAMGYGGSRKDAGQAIGRSGDDGIDGIIKEDQLGLDVVHIQAKRWKDTVGRPTVQGFAGSLEGNRARKGVLITTSQFSQEARDYVNRIEKRIVLIDGDQLTQLMMDHNIGVSQVASYTIKKLDQDYFEDV